MAWRPMLLRGARVLARCDDAGELVVDRGRVEVQYQEGGKVYRAAERNLHSLDAEGGPSTGASRFEPPTSRSRIPPSAPGGRGPGRIIVAARSPNELPSEPDPNSALAYTDGACSGNPGPAGVGVVLLQGSSREELSEYLGEATNNVAELTAIGRAAERADPSRPILVCSDSSYAIGVLSGQMKAKKNRELIGWVIGQLANHPEAGLCHVPAHSGVVLNERADELAVGAVRDRASRPWTGA